MIDLDQVETQSWVSPQDDCLYIKVGCKVSGIKRGCIVKVSREVLESMDGVGEGMEYPYIRLIINERDY